MRPPFEAAIIHGLDHCAERVKPIGPCRWSFELVNGRRLPASASWEGEWLAIRAALRTGGDPDLPWTLLRENAALIGPARFAWPAAQGAAIHADVAVIEPEIATQRVAAACESVIAAAAVRAGKSPDRRAPSPERRVPSAEPPSRRATEPPVSWAALAEEHGWRLTRREEHRIGVELDAPGVVNQAFIEPRRAGPVVSIEVLRAGELPPRARRAIARFLLALTARTDLVRAGVSDTEGEPAVRLEAALPDEPPASGLELDLALHALSLACRLGMREVRALAHEPLAGTYLAHTIKE
ncbi:MAG: hypothetical protein ACT4PM_02010 [Gemmatimonadales bacterium]